MGINNLNFAFLTEELSSGKWITDDTHTLNPIEKDSTWLRCINYLKEVFSCWNHKSHYENINASRIITRIDSALAYGEWNEGIFYDQDLHAFLDKFDEVTHRKHHNRIERVKSKVSQIGAALQIKQNAETLQQRRLEVDSAATTIQSLCRANAARQNAAQRQDEAKAVVKLQSLCRGHLASQDTAQIQDKVKAAVKLQSLCRSHLAGHDLEKAKALQEQQ